jgi:para-nitrobenzyl esterase
VTISSGRLRGRREEGCFVFRGIPYAMPPFGVRRFLPPEPRIPWSGVLDALADGATAPQPVREFTIIPEPVIAGEDCLNLNVFTPELGRAGLPVFVWIPGGGYFAGTNASPWYAGARFARDGIVVVSINYRLGIDGFMTLEDAPDNRGVLDLIAALAWVQENIESFGGDPANITIGGQSAGGAAATVLLAVPRARGLFRRVIAMSGSIGLQVERARIDAVSSAIARKLGVPRTRAGLAGVVLAKLVEAQLPDLVEAHVPLTGADVARMAAGAAEGGPPLQPVADGDLLESTAREAIQHGAGSDIPIMVGATQSEFNWHYARLRVSEEVFEESALRLGLTSEGIASYRFLYPEASPATLVGQLVSDRAFRIPAQELAELHARGAPTFVYDFRWHSQSTALPDLGACHCLDIPFAFDLLDAERVETVAGASPPQELATAMHEAWVAFCRDGDAGWPAYTVAAREVMIFDRPSRLQRDPLEVERRIWRLAASATPEPTLPAEA